MPLHGAAQRGHSDIYQIEFLIEVKNCSPASSDNLKTTPLHLATATGHIHIMKYLIEEKRCNPYNYDKVHGYPLHWAAYYAQSEAMKYYNIIEALNCLINIRGCRNKTPLELALDQGHINVVLYLRSFL